MRAATRIRSRLRPADPPRAPGGAAESNEARRDAIERGVVEALAYADVFDWPLTLAEIHRYLPVRATPVEVAAAVDEMAGAGAGPGGVVERAGDLAMLGGRDELPAIRRRRTDLSARLWPRAISWARIVGRLPLVRMVAVTGSLAVGAAGPRDDVDLFIVTADGRLWLTRAMTMLVVRAAGLRGLRLCPNYLVTASALEISDRSIYTARELAQMVPVTGASVYAELLSANGWYRDFLPNAEPAMIERPAASRRPGRSSRLARVPLAALEAALGSRLAGKLERWEMRRKQRQLRAASVSSETQYDERCCKGHADEHGRRVLAAFESRLRELGELDRRSEAM